MHRENRCLQLEGLSELTDFRQHGLEQVQVLLSLGLHGMCGVLLFVP